MATPVITVRTAAPHAKTAGINDYIRFPQQFLCLTDVDVAVAAGRVNNAFAFEAVGESATHKSICPHHDNDLFLRLVVPLSMITLMASRLGSRRSCRPLRMTPPVLALVGL